MEPMSILGDALGPHPSENVAVGIVMAVASSLLLLTRFAGVSVEAQDLGCALNKPAVGHAPLPEQEVGVDYDGALDETCGSDGISPGFSIDFASVTWEAIESENRIVRAGPER